jgi:hypothetical protein
MFEKKLSLNCHNLKFMINILYIVNEFILSERILKLHILKQSLLVSLWTSFLSMPMGADQQQLDAPRPLTAGTSVVAPTAKNKQIHKIPYESFYEELSKLMLLNPIFKEMINTSIQRINTFLSVDSKKEEVIQLTNLVLQELCGLVIAVDNIFTAFVEEHCDLSSRIDVVKIYKESSLSKIFISLQDMILNLIKK